MTGSFHHDRDRLQIVGLLGKEQMHDCNIVIEPRYTLYRVIVYVKRGFARNLFFWAVASGDCLTLNGFFALKTAMYGSMKPIAFSYEPT